MLRCSLKQFSKAVRHAWSLSLSLSGIFRFNCFEVYPFFGDEVVLLIIGVFYAEIFDLSFDPMMSDRAQTTDVLLVKLNLLPNKGIHTLVQTTT